MTRKWIALALVGLMMTTAWICLAGEDAAGGGDDWAKSRLGRTQLGTWWMGPKVTKEDLRGQVVLLEFWGYRCPPCIASIPHLSALSDKYSKNGLVVLGAHAQGSDKATALAVAKPRGVTFTIMSRARVPEASFTGIPRVFVFDHRGELVFEGRPNGEMDEAVVKALKARPHPLLGDRRYRRAGRIVSQIRSGRLGQAWKDATEKKDAEGAEGEEARALLANLKAYADQLVATAERAETQSPSECIAALSKLTKYFAGTSFAKKAAETLEQLKADEKFQAELKADREYLVIARAFDRVPGCPREDAAKGEWQAQYGSSAKQIYGRVKKLQAKLPDTLGARRAEDILKELMGQT